MTTMDTAEVLRAAQENNIQCAAFDIFDTLVERCVNPEYVKKIWAKEVCVRLHLAKKPEELYQMRRGLEAKICTENAKDGYDLDFQYAVFLQRLFAELTPALSFEEFASVCEEEEIWTECRVQSLCEGVGETLERLRAAGVRCICISDFYLPAADMRRILDFHGIGEYFDRIYVSCDYLLTKRSGRLYEAVLSEDGTGAGRILMIGDNQSSDRDNAVEHGYAALWLDRTDAHKRYEALWKEETAPGRAERAIRACAQQAGNAHFKDIVYSLYAFTQLLHEQLVHDRCRSVFFLSREGEFLKKIFDYYQQANRYAGPEKIDTHYLIVSRKATFIPSLKPLDEEDFFVLFRQYRAISLYDFLSSLNFDGDVIDRIAGELQADKMERLEDLPTSGVFARMKELPLFREEYERIRTEQYENFVRYLDQFGVEYRESGLFLVDVGWKGSIQDNLFRLFDGQVEMNGYYLGLVATGNMSEKNRKMGVLFQGCGDVLTSNYPIYSANCSIFEMVLAATHGSADGYYEKDGRIEAATHAEPEEEKIYQTTIKGMLEQIFASFQMLAGSLACSDVVYGDYMAMVTKMHATMILNPTREEMAFFRDMYHYENFGVFRYTRFSRKKLGFALRMKNLARFIKAPKSILNAGFWAPLTLEDAGLGYLKKPYAVYKMYRYKTLLEGERER